MHINPSARLHIQGKLRRIFAMALVAGGFSLIFSHQGHSETSPLSSERGTFSESRTSPVSDVKGEGHGSKISSEAKIKGSAEPKAIELPIDPDKPRPQIPPDLEIPPESGPQPNPQIPPDPVTPPDPGQPGPTNPDPGFKPSPSPSKDPVFLRQPSRKIGSQDRDATTPSQWRECVSYELTIQRMGDKNVKIRECKCPPNYLNAGKLCVAKSKGIGIFGMLRSDE